MTRGHHLRAAAVALATSLALTLLGLGYATTAPAQAATQTFDLFAVTGSSVMPNGQTVTVWGYSADGSPVTRPGGPTLVVDAGDTVEITLHNQVGEATSLLVQGQSVPPDLTGVGAGGTTTYSFTADQPGTYLYEAGPLPNAQHQVAMGLYGAFVVRPAVAGQAYGSVDTAFDDEAVLLLGEVDPALNNAANPAGFDMRKYSPKFFLVNGRAHPDTAPIPTSGGNIVLLRYVNAGMQYHSMGVLGVGQSVIALDGAPLEHARHYVAETFGPGQTADALVTAPTAPTTDTRLSVYDASLLLHNSNAAGFGGMLTTIDVPGTPTPGDETGPVSRTALVVGNTLTATVDDAGHGDSTIQAAEYYLDDVTGAATALAAVTDPFDAVQEDVTATVTVPGGQHVFYLRGQDAAGNWGPFTSVLVSGADQGGPTTTSPTLTPRLTNHSSTGVAVSATADDTASGNSAIAAAEYFLDAVGADGSGTTMTVNQNAPVASIDGTIPAATVNALPEGSHVVSVHAKDDQENWGALVTVNLDVDLTGPGTSGVSVDPTPNNGTLRYNSSTPAVRVIATTMSDPVSGSVNSTIRNAEAFIDTVGANGTGIPLNASDGTFNDASEGGYADIPLTTVQALANGAHTIHVHARDAAGNWGATGTATLVVDKTRPTVTSVTATPNPTQGSTTVVLSATATDNLTAINRAEWFRGADPGTGNGTAMTVTGTGPYTAAAIVDVQDLSEGSYPLSVRVRDAAGNWSTAVSTTLVVRGPLYFSTFGNTNPPGAAGTADDADVYSWSGTGYTRSIDVSTAAYGLPAVANVDGLVRVDATHFYLSFSNANTAVPGAGTVQDEDVVYYNAGTWSVFFDGTANGLGGTDNLDLDAISVDVSGSTLYFSTFGNTNPPGVGGAADDADIYSWNGTSYGRVWDASANGLAAGANVDGFDRVDATRFHFSFSGLTTTVPGVGTVQDEDVVRDNAGTWSVYFDGTAHGLTSDNLDVDAFDVP